MKKQTAGRTYLGKVAPKFAQLNDDVLFGEVWAREDEFSLRDRSLVTISALFALGLFPQLKSHLELGKEHGLAKTEVVETLTQLAFYCGWPKAWSAFPLVEEVYGKEGSDLELSPFAVGEENPFGRYFSGKSYLYPLSTKQVPIYNVTFEPGCRNAWHIHRAKSGGGQILICVYGKGWYQEEGKEARELRPGDVVNIPPNVKHWHGAAKDSYFQHLAIEVAGEETKTEWREAVEEKDYLALDQGE